MAGTAFSAADWRYYHPATAAPAASVSDFSFVLDLSELHADVPAFGSTVQSDGADIRVTLNDGTTELAYDLIDWAYNAGSPTGFLRLLYPGGSGTSFTVRVWTSYDAGTAVAYDATETYGSDNAYDADWVSYHPLAADVNDRTSNGYHLTDPGGAASPASGSAGVLTGAYDFDGGDYLYHDHSVDEPLTMMAWFEPDAVNVDSSVCSAASTAGNDRFHWLYLDETAGLNNARFLSDGRGNGSNNGYATAAVTSPAGSFYHLAGTVEAGGASRDVIFDGGVATAADGTTCDTGALNRFAVGARAEGTAFAYHPDGRLCEIQLHAVERDSDWISEEYDQASDNDSYWSFGSQVDTGGGGSIIPQVMHHRRLMGVS